MDIFGRQIDYFRVSVTGKCNMRCIYCMPASAGKRPEHGYKPSVLSFEEIYKAVFAAASLGIRKVRLTGGEPLLRRGIEKLIADLAVIPGLDYLSMTTNGVLLAEKARALKNAGLNGVNVSLDSLDSGKFQKITGFGRVGDIVRGIENALAENLLVKLNVVLLKDLNDNEIIDFVDFARKMAISVRFIEFMPVKGSALPWHKDKIISIAAIKNSIEKHFGKLLSADSQKIKGFGPAEYYQTEIDNISVGFISASCGKYCYQCNRIRLTSEGMIKNCLFGKSEISIKESLSEPNWYEEARMNLINSVALKPKGYFISGPKTTALVSPQMSLVGG
jgi:cyclic pyranopterin phosphate synthase